MARLYPLRHFRLRGDKPVLTVVYLPACCAHFQFLERLDVDSCPRGNGERMRMEKREEQVRGAGIHRHFVVGIPFIRSLSGSNGGQRQVIAQPGGS